MCVRCLEKRKFPSLYGWGGTYTKFSKGLSSNPSLRTVKIRNTTDREEKANVVGVVRQFSLVL